MYSDKVLEQLMRDEGSVKIHGGRHVLYTCPTGHATIGYGRNLEAKGISEDEAKYLLGNDVIEVMEQITSRWPAFLGLDDARKGAVVNLAFNLGVAGFLGFQRMVRALERERWDEAAEELLDSRYAEQVGHRASRLAEQIKTGTWQ